MEATQETSLANSQAKGHLNQSFQLHFIQHTFLLTTSLDRTVTSPGSSTGDISPSMRLNLLNPITADDHTP